MNKYYIYLITNIINGHMYVGQTINLKKRWSEHKRPSRHKTVIEKAFNKYGASNFKLDVLEIVNSTGEANAREVYWIHYFNTFNNPIHYNCHIGGRVQHNENNPMFGLKGEQCPISKITKELGIKIYYEYKNNSKNTIYSLSDKYNVSTTIISDICKGKHFATDTLTSVIRENNGVNRNNCLDKEQCFNIYKLYKDKLNTIEELSYEFQACHTVIREICKGIHWSTKGMENLMNELHTSSKITKDIGIEILTYYNEINNLKKTFQHFKNKYNISYRTTQRICSKQHWAVLDGKNI